MNLKKLTLTHYIFIGILLGVLAGWIIGESILPIADPLAKLFLRLLRMAIMPLIITSIISGVLSVGTARGLGSLGIKTFLLAIMLESITMVEILTSLLVRKQDTPTVLQTATFS